MLFALMLFVLHIYYAVAQLFVFNAQALCRVRYMHDLPIDVCGCVVLSSAVPPSRFARAPILCFFVCMRADDECVWMGSRWTVLRVCLWRLLLRRASGVDTAASSATRICV